MAARRLGVGLRAFAFLLRSVLSSLARVRVRGLENVPPDGPLIVVANHVSNADPPLIGAWLIPTLNRQIAFMAKEQLFAPPLGILLRALGAIRVRAGGSDADAYRRGRAVLMRGGVLGLFPEGSRSRDGALRRSHQGVALLAARSGALILPVGVSGTHRFLPAGSWWPRVGTRISVVVGAPFRITLDETLPRREATAHATDELMRRIAELLPLEQRGRYGSPPTAEPGRSGAAATGAMR